MHFEREIMDSFRQIVQGLRVSSREAEQELGISGAQLFVLRTLAEEGTMSVNDLAERTRTHQSSVSEVLARLDQRGLVKRAKSKEDGRRVEVTITREGQAKLKPRKKLAQERLVAAIQELEVRDKAALATLLKEVVVNAGFESEAPKFFFEGKDA